MARRRTPIRARLYSGWGLTATQVTRVVVFCFVAWTDISLLAAMDG